MKRLSVRLSIVGAVLALGSAAIAYSLLTKPKDAKSPEGERKVAARDSETPSPPAPIHTDGNPPPEPTSTLQPPPASVFERPNSLRTVSHETNPGEKESDESREAAKSADIIPTEDPADVQTSHNSSFPIAGPNYGANPATSTARQGTPTANAAEPSDSVVPPNPSYGGGFRTSDATEAVGSGLSDARPAGASGVAGLSTMTPPTTTPPVNPAESQATLSTGNSSRLGPPSSAFSTNEPGSSTTTPTSTVRTGGSSSLPAYIGNTSDDRTAGPVGSDRTPVGNTATPKGLRDGTTPATDTASPTATSGAAAGLAGAQPAGSLSGTVSPPAPAYPTTDSMPRTGARSGAYAQSITNPYSDASPGTTSANTTNTYGQGVAASVYPSSSASPSATAPYGATTYPSGAALNADPASPLVSDVPGSQELEGQQTPTILIEKLAPEEIQVERKATFTVRVRNTGNAVAHNVVVVDRIPRGTQLIDTVPPVTPTADGTLVWQLETVKPGEEVVLSMNLLPKVAGEIGSVAQATFQAQASVRTICTKPELKLDLTIPSEVLIGQPATLDITVTNTGNGAAEKVVLEEDVPEGFTHAAGRQLEHEIGTLRPQESRRLTLALNATQAGSFENRLSVHGEGNLRDENIRKIEVTSPQLQIAIQGPTLRYLDRQATYSVHLANPGTASARNVELVTYLPKGMKYVTSDNQGQYDSQSHAVYWSLEELPPAKQGDVHFTVLPIEPGTHKLKTDGRADLGLQQACEHEVAVEGLAELAFTVSDAADPIEVGSDTAYEVRIQNKGSKPDTDIKLVAELPEGIMPSAGDGPTQGTVQGQRVLFAPLARLGPGQEAVYKIHARGTVNGDHVVRVQVRSAELSVPVTKEEITRVYSDK